MTRLRRAVLLMVLAALMLAPVAPATSATGGSVLVGSQATAVSAAGGSAAASPATNLTAPGQNGTGQSGPHSTDWPELFEPSTVIHADTGDATTGAELAVVDTTVDDHSTLARAAREAGMDVANVSSAAEMQAALAERSNLTAVHVLSHGTIGTIQIGDDTLQRETLDQYSGLMGELDSSLAADGDVLLYGCRVAENGAGRAFVGDVANATGGDVAASDDLTGNASQGGDWELETNIGDIGSHALDSAVLGQFSTTLDLLNKGESVSFTIDPANGGADSYLMNLGYAGLPNNNIVVLREEYDGSHLGWYLDHYDSNGNRLDRTRIDSLVSPKTNDPIDTDIRIRSLDDGRLLMWWETSSSGKAIDNPYFRLIDPDGTALTSATRINQNTGDLDRFTRATQLSNGNIAFVWAHGGSEYRMRIFQPDGTPVIDENSLT